MTDDDAGYAMLRDTLRIMSSTFFVETGSSPVVGSS